MAMTHHTETDIAPDRIADDAWSDQMAERLKPILDALIAAKPAVQPEVQAEVGSQEWLEARIQEMTYPAVRKRDVLDRQAARTAVQEENHRASLAAQALTAANPPPCATTEREHKLDAILRKLADQRVSMVRDRRAILQSWLDRGTMNSILLNHVVNEWGQEQPHDQMPETQPKRRWWR